LVIGVERGAPALLRLEVARLRRPRALRSLVGELDDVHALAVLVGKDLVGDVARHPCRDLDHPLHGLVVLGGVLRPQARAEDGDDHAWRPFSLACLTFGAAHTPGRPRASTTSMKRAVPNQTTRKTSQTATPVPNE